MVLLTSYLFITSSLNQFPAAKALVELSEKDNQMMSRQLMVPGCPLKMRISEKTTLYSSLPVQFQFPDLPNNQTRCVNMRIWKPDKPHSHTCVTIGRSADLGLKQMRCNCFIMGA
jgi:hypothetical protein